MSAPVARWQGIAARVMILTATGMLAAIALLGWTNWSSLRRLEAEVQFRREATLAAVGAHLDERLTGVFGRLQTLATDARPALAEPPQVPPLRALQAAYLDSAYLDAVFVTDATGRILIADPPAAASSGLDLATLVARVVSKGVPVSSELVETPGRAGAPAGHHLVLLVPVRDWAGKVVGASGGTLDPEGRRFRQLASTVLNPKLGHVLLLDANNHLIASADARGAVVGETRPDRGYVATHALTMAPLRLVLDDDAGTAAPAFLTTLAWVTPFILGLALLFAWGAGRSVSRPLLLLTDSAERIAWGDLNVPVPPMGEDEVGRLGRSFERMRQALQKSLEKIAAANAELEQRVADRTRELARVNAELQQRERVRQQLLRKVITAQEDERKRLARELHDETTQTMTALGVRLDLALAAPPDVRERELVEARALAARSLNELRRLMHDLRPSVLDDLGLVPALEWYAERHFTPPGTSVRFEVGPLPERLPYELETALFRTVQEALTNVSRHAGAEMVLVEIAADHGQLTIDIEDDGQGFDPAEIAPRPGDLRGLGLLGMRERVELFGGTVTIDSTPGRGTHVSIRVPLPQDSAHGQDPSPDR
jgi:signal transduction histidine kinase